MEVIYYYVENGYTAHGDKIPDIPIIHLAVEAGRRRARGPAVVDTGFDGGVYPNIEVVELFRGIEPDREVVLENPIHGPAWFEVYKAKTYLYGEDRFVEVGVVGVYVSKEPELLTEEVLVGREFLNKLRVVLEPDKKLLRVMTVEA